MKTYEYIINLLDEQITLTTYALRTKEGDFDVYTTTNDEVIHVRRENVVTTCERVIYADEVYEYLESLPQTYTGPAPEGVYDQVQALSREGLVERHLLYPHGVKVELSPLGARYLKRYQGDKLIRSKVANL